MKPAIILSAHTMGTGVIRSLGPLDVPVIAVSYDHDDMGTASRYVHETIKAPHPTYEEREFIELLVRCADRFGGGLLIPASDETVMAVSKHKRLLEDHYVVACTDWDVSRRFVHKQHTYQLAESVGVPAPKTFILRTQADLLHCGRLVTYPCLIKPCTSHEYFQCFGTKMQQVDSLEQAQSAYQEASLQGFEVMLQEWIPGDDDQGANYNSYFWDGQPLVEFTAQQIRNGPPNTGSPRVVKSKVISDVIEPGRRILQAIGFEGYSCIEFKKDARDGVYKLMEVNGRHNRSGMLAVRCGINFPWLQYQHLMQGRIPNPLDFEENVYWIALSRDVVFSIRHRKEEHYTLPELLRPYLHRHVFSALDLRDPGPIIRRCSKLARNVRRDKRSTVIEIKQERQQVGEGENERGCRSDRRRALADS